MKLLAFILLCGLAFAQDAPKPATYCGRFHWSCWNDHDHNRPWSKVLSDPTTYLAPGIDFAATTADVETTKWGLGQDIPGQGPGHTYCVEGNIHPPRPTRGQLYRSQLPENFAAFGGSILMAKLRAPTWLPMISIAPSFGIHMHGVASWVGCR